MYEIPVNYIPIVVICMHCTDTIIYRLVNPSPFRRRSPSNIMSGPDLLNGGIVSQDLNKPPFSRMGHSKTTIQLFMPTLQRVVSRRQIVSPFRSSNVPVLPKFPNSFKSVCMDLAEFWELHHLLKIGG